jgi:3',5'-cyclic AMP phosphodiesterase CpdA
VGNHDAVMGGWKNFQKYFGALYYSFDYQDSHFIILNNAFRESFGKEQFEWLKKDLAASRARHKFVFMHRPTFDPSEIYSNYIMSGREVTQELMLLFSRYKVDYVFAGHIHGYAKAERDGVTYIVTAGGGAPLYLPSGFGGFYHYVIISVENGKVSDRVVKINE